MTLHKKAEVLADQLVQAIEGMIHSYDYNGACHRISEALVAFAEATRIEGVAEGIQTKVEYEMSEAIKQARNTALEEAAKLADLRDPEEVVASAIRALKTESK